MAVCARADAMAVCARADAIAVWGTANGESAKGNLRKSAKGNLRKGICKGGIVLRTTDGRRSNVGSDCSKTNF